MLRILRGLPLLAVVLLILPVQSSAQHSGGFVRSQANESTGIEVRLILPPNEKLGRALEIGKVVRATTDVDRIIYAVSEDDTETAEITHTKEASADSLAELVKALTDLMVDNIVVKIRVADSP